MGEEEPGEPLLHFDVLDDLQARVLVRVPILYQPCKDNSEITVYDGETTNNMDEARFLRAAKTNG